MSAALLQEVLLALQQENAAHHLQVAELAQARDEAVALSGILQSSLRKANADIDQLNETIAAYQTTAQTVSDMLGDVCDAKDERRAELDARVHEVEGTSAAAAAGAPAAISERKVQMKAAGNKKHKKRLQKIETGAADLTLDSSKRRDNCEASIQRLLLPDATVGE
eukprot:18112-Heterococcus_DN1.PRE.2